MESSIYFVNAGAESGWAVFAAVGIAGALSLLSVAGAFCASDGDAAENAKIITIAEAAVLKVIIVTVQTHAHNLGSD